MTENERVYWSFVTAASQAVAQQGYLIWLERMTAFMALGAAPAPAAPIKSRPKLTVVR